MIRMYLKLKKLIGSKRRFLIEIFSVLIVCAFLATSLMPFIGHSGTAVNAKSVYGTPTVSTNKVIGTISVKETPYGVAFDSINGDVYVADEFSDYVSVINGATNNVIDNITVGTDPAGVAFDSSNRDVYVANYGSNNTSVINGATNNVIDNITVGTNPYGVAFDSINGDVYVTNYDSYTVSVISPIYVKYPVTFSESGLPTGSDWYVNITESNGTHYDSGAISGSSYTLNLANGSYTYTIATSNHTYKPSASSGSFTVNGKNLPISVTFIEVTYPVTFSESGLPTGTTWTLVFDGRSYTLTNTSYAFQEPNGTYSYSATSTDYKDLSGSVQVNGKSQSVTLSFVLQTYSVTFSESGLPTGSDWYVNITGHDSGPITSSTYTLSLSNGSYTYTIATSNHTYKPSAYSGSFGVVGQSPSPIYVTFSEVTYSVTFSEYNLPYGTDWYINIKESNGTTYNSGSISAASFSFHLSNGTYSYTISSSDRSSVPLPSMGSFTVDGTSVSESVVFLSIFRYTVTFSESGLSNGTEWFVNLSNGRSYHSLSDTISFQEPNGIYSYSISTPDTSYRPTSSGSFTVDDSSVSISVKFQQVDYTVTFSESGLPNGTEWFVNLSDGQSFSSTNSTISFSVPNGTYSYIITTASLNKVNALSGSISLTGRSIMKNITFPAMERSPERSGISDGSFYIIIGAVAAATIITLVTAVMIRKRK